MTDFPKPMPGDRVGFLDFEAVERVGTVTAFVDDASGCGAGFSGFICWDPITEKYRWGYLSQITDLNGVATTV